MRDGCALVTGASRGIGAATALALATDGWPVGVNFRTDSDGAERVVERIAAAAEQLFGALEERFGPVLVLVNNAGVRADALAPQLCDDDWELVLDTNLSAAFRLTRRALRRMVTTRFGRVVNVASVVGPRANPGQANYAASKAGLIGFTRTVAAEVARRGVTVNAVAPGFVETEMTNGLLERAVKEIPARRVGTPDEVAACVRFLASDDAAYVTGTTLTVDGGLSA
jgi:3-oxoacyl-[acyl-carrier protein] reductase